MIIWLPINKNRDFNFDIINKDNLVKSIDNFNAFTASGVTYGTTTKVSILTRYEEINNLMYHSHSILINRNSRIPIEVFYWIKK